MCRDPFGQRCRCLGPTLIFVRDAPRPTLPLNRRGGITKPLRLSLGMRRHSLARFECAASGDKGEVDPPGPLGIILQFAADRAVGIPPTTLGLQPL
jgi:hypothetical protein